MRDERNVPRHALVTKRKEERDYCNRSSGRFLCRLRLGVSLHNLSRLETGTSQCFCWPESSIHHFIHNIVFRPQTPRATADVSCRWRATAPFPRYCIRQFEARLMRAPSPLTSARATRPSRQRHQVLFGTTKSFTSATSPD